MKVDWKSKAIQYANQRNHLQLGIMELESKLRLWRDAVHTTSIGDIERELDLIRKSFNAKYKGLSK